jgi:nucleoside phosphorylase/CheY-like chemotaxis protein
VTVSVLLLDDSERRIRAISTRLEEGAKEVPVKITVAGDSATARRFLRSSHFDLMVLDIALPLFPKESPAPRAGLEFLKEVTFDEDYMAPTHVVGVTAYEEGFVQLEAEFEKHCWPLYRADETTDGWLNRIHNLVRHIDHAANRITRKVDFAIVTALYDPELKAVLSLPWDWTTGEPLDEATIVRRGSFRVGNRDFSVIATWPQRMGLVVSAALVSKINQIYRPRVIAASGICAGVRGKTELGDIVLASEAWTWESGKIISTPRPGTLQPDPHYVAANPALVALSHQLQGDVEWLRGIGDGWTESAAVPRPPRLLTAPMASGSTVVADEETVGSIISHSRKTVAIDMEAYAVYAAAAFGGQPVPLYFCVKSVCDFADSQKGDSHQRYAAYTSACALERICRELTTSLPR